MAEPRKLTVLITGCSPGGMGAALAVAFHTAGHHAYASARNLDKLTPLSSLGIHTIPLDVTSTVSIASAVDIITQALSTHSSTPSTIEPRGLDILINNAGGHYAAPISDVLLDSAKTLFDLNVWAHLAVTQAFLPLLMKSASYTPVRDGPATPMIVNHTSVGSTAAMPWQSVYSASKAAFARLSDGMRLELAAFGIRVVELKTAMVQSNFIQNSNINNVEGMQQMLPEGSFYEPAREMVEAAMSQKQFDGKGTTAEKWAEGVMSDLMKRNPPAMIWRGESAVWARLAAFMPVGVSDGFLRKMMKLDVVEDIIQQSRR
ncbi:short-chain dehydrogenase [Seiridium cupressi]